jgi:hypothetical protein
MSRGTRVKHRDELACRSEGKTTLTLTVLYESREARDTALKSPMEEGVAMGFDRLAEIVEKP